VNDVDALGINKQRNPVIDRKKKETACKKKQRNEETRNSRGLSNFILFFDLSSRHQLRIVLIFWH